jgi:hypothetical protein
MLFVCCHPETGGAVGYVPDVYRGAKQTNAKFAVIGPVEARSHLLESANRKLHVQLFNCGRANIPNVKKDVVSM